MKKTNKIPITVEISCDNDEQVCGKNCEYKKAYDHIDWLDQKPCVCRVFERRDEKEYFKRHLKDGKNGNYIRCQNCIDVFGVCDTTQKITKNVEIEVGIKMYEPDKCDHEKCNYNYSSYCSLFDRRLEWHGCNNTHICEECRLYFSGVTSGVTGFFKNLFG